MKGLGITLEGTGASKGSRLCPGCCPTSGAATRSRAKPERACIPRHCASPPAMPFRLLEGPLVLDGLRCDVSVRDGCQLGYSRLERGVAQERSGRPHAETPAAPVVDPLDTSEPGPTRRSDLALLPPGDDRPTTIGQKVVASADLAAMTGAVFGLVVGGVPASTSSASALDGRRTALAETRRALAPEITAGHVSWWHVEIARAAEREDNCSLPGARRSSARFDCSQPPDDPSARP